MRLGNAGLDIAICGDRARVEIIHTCEQRVEHEGFRRLGPARECERGVCQEMMVAVSLMDMKERERKIRTPELLRDLSPDVVEDIRRHRVEHVVLLHVAAWVELGATLDKSLGEHRALFAPLRAMFARCEEQTQVRRGLPVRRAEQG